MLILGGGKLSFLRWGGGSIDTWLGKDPQRLWKDHLNLERISSWVSIDPPSPPPPPKKWQLPSWVLIDPPTSLPSLPLPPHLRNDNFQVECRSTPPSPPSPPKKWQLSSWVSIDPPLRVVSIWGRSTVFKQNSSHSTATKTSLCGKVPVDSDLHISLRLAAPPPTPPREEIRVIIIIINKMWSITKDNIPLCLVPFP